MACRWPIAGPPGGAGHWPHLERDVARMRDDPGTDLHELLPEAGQRPVRDCLGQRQRAQEIAEIISESMKLEPHSIG